MERRRAGGVIRVAPVATDPLNLTADGDRDLAGEFDTSRNCIAPISPLLSGPYGRIR